MATQTVEFPASTGRTLTAKLFALGSDTQTASVSATEATNRKGIYTVAFTDVAAGEYDLVVLDGSSIPAYVGYITLTLTTATFYPRGDYALPTFSQIWTTALTESYAADGAAPTPAQALFLIQQMLTEFAISSTTLTAKKLDGSTTAATFTLSDATNPTSITRAS